MRLSKQHFRMIVALVATLGLMATACGGGGEGPDDVVNSSGVAKTGWGAPVDQTPVEEASAEDDAPRARSLGAPSESEESGQPDTDVEEVAASVLAYVIENSEGVSYSFDQGFSMSFEFDDLSMQIAPSSPFVTGEVDGTNSHVRADIGVVMRETFASLGLDPDDPEFAGLGAAFDDARFEVWTEGEVMTLDMADFVSAMNEVEPGSMSELDLLSDGPVSLDLGALEDVDPWMLTQALGEGSQVVDPSALLDALRSVESVTEVGPATVGGRDVTVYSGSLSMDDYFSAMGQDIDHQLGMFSDLGAETDGIDTSTFDSLGDALSNIDVHVTVMVDEQNLLRRMETVMNMGEMMSAMFDDSIQVEMSVGVWQDFDQYGQSFDIEAPDAVDVTGQFNSLFSDLVSV